MIIYGSKAKQLAKETLLEKCPHCQSQNSVDMHVFQKYAHVFWIPFVPTGKTGVSQCLHCKQALKLKEMPSSLAVEYNRIKSNTRTPLWMFIGLALLVALIVSVAVDENKKAAATAKYIQHLQPNDLVEIKIEEGYTYLKVTDVKGDTVFVKNNKQVAVTERGVSKLGIADASFYDDVYPATQQALLAQYKAKKILNVIRR